MYSVPFFCNNMVDKILITVKMILLKWRQNLLQASRMFYLLPNYEQYEEAAQKNLKISTRKIKMLY